MSAVFQWALHYIMAGVSQRTVYRLRQDVDRKLARLPLNYFDSHPHGDILSRVTNDIDNIANTLQQSLTQIITLGLHDRRRADHDADDQPAAGADLAPRAPARGRRRPSLIARQSQRQFAAQWERTGTLNGHVEETHTGHNDRQGLRPPGATRSGGSTRRTRCSSRRASGRSSSRDHPAHDELHRQPQLRRHRRHRRRPGRVRAA